MYDDTNREICTAIQVDKSDRAQYKRVRTLLWAIDHLLTSLLEELKLRGIGDAPAAERSRAAALVADVRQVALQLVRVPRRIEEVAGMLLDSEEQLLRELVRLRARDRLAKRLAPPPGRAAWRLTWSNEQTAKALPAGEATDPAGEGWPVYVQRCWLLAARSRGPSRQRVGTRAGGSRLRQESREVACNSH